MNYINEKQKNEGILKRHPSQSERAPNGQCCNNIRNRINLTVFDYRGKQWKGKDQRSPQENQRYQGNISRKDGHDKGPKWYGPNRSRRHREYTEELYKKDLNDPDDLGDVITHLELDILECEVKWALGSITYKQSQGNSS